ncbi:MAG: HD domain-containing protein [Microvirga sp.]|nr:HD domain-containing protein [Microvirga sp.]
MPLRVNEVLLALSRALDVTEGQPAGHALRCGLISHELGRALGYREPALSELFHAVLLKDLGCSSNAARICALYLTDDLSFKRDFKVVGDSLPQALRFVLNHTGLQSGLAERFRALIQVVGSGGRIAHELIETRCQRGAAIALRMGFSQAVAEGVRDLDEHWDGSGRPAGLAGEAISPFARIALAAQVADVFFTSGGPDAAIRELRARRGTWFEPKVVDALCDLSGPGFWASVSAAPTDEGALRSPAFQAAAIDADVNVDDIATGFAEVVDAKSPFTAGHSARVALYADLIAVELGLDAGRRAVLGRGALLHDIGKLGVSNQVLDKPGKLDEAEWRAIRAHPVDGCAILGAVDSFAYLARLAEAHHERLDGKGYPHGLGEAALDLETRIVTTADVFDALTADRPYRAAMSFGEALGVMRRDIGTAFDPDCFNALQRVSANI